MKHRIGDGVLEWQVGRQHKLHLPWTLEYGMNTFKDYLFRYEFWENMGGIFYS